MVKYRSGRFECLTWQEGVKPLRRKRIELTKLGGIHPAAAGTRGDAIFGRGVSGCPVATGAFAVGMRRERRRRRSTSRVVALSFGFGVLPGY
jgi:hypothetical protein